MGLLGVPEPLSPIEKLGDHARSKDGVAVRAARLRFLAAMPHRQLVGSLLSDAKQPQKRNR
jgi:hypothetical protein